MLRPTPPPYDPMEWLQKPLAERGRMVCEAWALQGYGTPLAIYLVHALKVVFYIGVWRLFCGNIPWLSTLAFQKAILWSLLFEGLGLGCGFGPLTGHYFPPMGGALHFLRPGTTKLSLWPRVFGIRRNLFDVALYAAVIGFTVRALLAPAIDFQMLLPIVIGVPLLGVFDRTTFLAFRGEHYWTTVVCFAFAGNWIAGAKAVQLALWFWAGFSKLNHHFPAVVCVMTSNSPFTRFAWLRKRMYRRFPDDLRPSSVAVGMSHAGTFFELGVPLVLLASMFTGSHTLLVIAMVMMLLLHGFITSNVPMGVPIEWNFMVVYGAFALFWTHPEVTLLQLGSTPLAAFLIVALIVIPLTGNLFPGALSFLLAMRYYAGNWAYGVWLFRGDSYKKLERVKKSAPWIYEQLDRFYDRKTSIGLVGKVVAFRMMHLQGRALPVLIPKAVERLQDYEYLDGEIVAGLVLGWNFGDGHLHREGLLSAVQEQCGFEEGELRCIFVEGQPFLRPRLDYRIHDAKTGLIEKGALDVRELRQRQPWLAE
jgi:hypothetical protein